MSRVKQLSSDVYNFVFQMLDCEPEGYDAGKVATEVQRSFEYAMFDVEELAELIILNAVRYGDIEYTLDALPCYDSVEGNAMCSGDDDFDTLVEDTIIERLEGGDVWAWFDARVTCSAPGYRAVGYNYLGQCSYASEEEFMRDAYYDDMRSEARRSLKEQIILELKENI